MENMEKVDMFSWNEVCALVQRTNKHIVESILECECNACKKVKYLDNIKTTEEVISDIQLFSDEDVRPASNNSPRDLGAGDSKAVLFAMLCYLGTPFMMHFDLWETASRDPENLDFVRFRLVQPQVSECFSRLYELELEEKAEGNSGTGSAISGFNTQAEEFINAFQKVEHQFQPLRLPPRIQPWKVSDNTVFPFQDFKFQARGGQATIYVIKILEEFRKDLKMSHSIDVKSPLLLISQGVLKLYESNLLRSEMLSNI